ncbi:MAG: twin-arginine translocase TatA/TatE family subunit [Dethiobacter sp.]|nr:MAG: twin-arginine translocase TatA/TatE family subunit [Dethiobacter sp.]
MFGKLGWMEVALIIGIILIIFGPGKLPGLSRAVGEMIRNYKHAVTGKDEAQTKEAKKTKEK